MWGEMSVQSVLFSVKEGVGGSCSCSECLLGKRCMDVAVRTLCPHRLSKQLLTISCIEEVTG